MAYSPISSSFPRWLGKPRGGRSALSLFPGCLPAACSAASELLSSALVRPNKFIFFLIAKLASKLNLFFVRVKAECGVLVTPFSEFSYRFSLKQPLIMNNFLCFIAVMKKQNISAMRGQSVLSMALVWTVCQEAPNTVYFGCRLAVQ